MTLAAKSGVIIYSNNINALSAFYIAVFDLVTQKETEDFISLSNEAINIIVHVPPIEMPNKHFNRVKLFLTVASHKATKQKVIDHGGSTLEGEWANPIFKICNVSDPEGNHIQIREFYDKALKQ